ncbi:methyltransferase domain-containing protein [Rhizosphaericola mali]|uniref:Methyltransferase domain-containing protein n=1 Tax=Rhizosphaericola mali TaxID=2545455 RepID=A0A5P2FWH2_9BACT|nr:methyltransferase domain-containing protein [Rhizosphaericola mali]QES87874.1 methyltransferase domain-containing protein [Rhizosphaericola mali]
MEIKRKPFQGVWNIVRFNWQFYLIATAIFIFVLFSKNWFPFSVRLILNIGMAIAAITIIVSLLASYYIYDYSNLYQLNWIQNINLKKTLNINAGFDETSNIIQKKFPQTQLTICDFYNAQKHTEVSIKRARKAYPPNIKTIAVTTGNLPFESNYFDKVFAILSAHEIRNKKERIIFFKELNRITKSDGKIYVTEHLRDVNNCAVYSIGFFHFHSRKTWLETFESANLTLLKEFKTTPFITTFVLK